MQDVLYIEEVEQAQTLLSPIRVELLKQMIEPRTCPELAAHFGESAQKVYYHVKALEKAGLVEKTAERRVRGTVEGYYQAKARSYWIAPHLVGKLGGKRAAKDQTSLHVLLSLAEEIHDDIGKLATYSAVGKSVPSLSLSAHIELAGVERRAEFLNEVQTIFQALATKYGSEALDMDDGDSFRLILACYPKKEPKE